MSDPIKPGDLVIVVRYPCSCQHSGIPDPQGGWVVTVGEQCSGWRCPQCEHAELFDPSFRLMVGSSQFVRPPRCLKKIPPFGALDGEPSQEKLVEPLKADAKRRHAEQDRPKERMQ